MAIQISYPTATSVTLSDKLLGTQYDPETGSAITKNFSISSIVSLVATYKVYIAQIVQSNETAPIATVIQNTIGNISFEYDGVGNYYVVSNGLFALNKTVPSITPGFWYEGFDNPQIAYTIQNSVDRINIRSFSSPDLSDNILGNAGQSIIEIRVYN